MKHFLTLALIALSAPALAQPMQFETKTAPAPLNESEMPSGIDWLQKRPMSLFDLGMTELTRATETAARTNPDLAGGVADYHPETGAIALSFYTRKAYTQQLCADTALDLRDVLFPKRDDTAALANELAAYFTSYGTPPADKPVTIGAELLQRVTVAVYMRGGICHLPLIGDMPVFWADPSNAPKQDEKPDAAKPATPAKPTAK